MFDRCAAERSAPPVDNAQTLTSVEDAQFVTTPGAGEIFLGRRDGTPIYVNAETTFDFFQSLRYFGSQPWPLPASLMIGFVIEADHDTLTLDENELADARWYARDELDALKLSGPISLSRWMIESWRSC